MSTHVLGMFFGGKSLGATCLLRVRAEQFVEPRHPKHLAFAPHSNSAVDLHVSYV